ncbi:hypothetical protein EYF80_031666 [Liparis tanakae]|uniref:Uncharacterized protein n=1 Tax=Liparis tanakae TaxID=230148 RepID=A0A4Z2GZD8_9TELE|nr:hypothetical protein EYF80_031666 [Liparis tanakae]
MKTTPVRKLLKMTQRAGTAKASVVYISLHEVDASPCPPLFDVEPGEDVDDAHHHVKHYLLPLADAEVRLAVDDPEGHDAPVQHDEDAKVELEHGGEQGEGDDPRGDGEEVPTELDDHRQLVCLYDDAQLQHQLRRALQKGGQQVQHAHVGELVDHPPVVTPTLRLCTLTAPDAQWADLLRPRPPPAVLAVLFVAVFLLAVDACRCGVAGWCCAVTSPCEAEPLSSLFPSAWAQSAAADSVPPSSVPKSWTNHLKLKSCTEKEPSTTKKSVRPNHQYSRRSHTSVPTSATYTATAATIHRQSHSVYCCCSTPARGPGALEPPTPLPPPPQHRDSPLAKSQSPVPAKSGCAPAWSPCAEPECSEFCSGVKATSLFFIFRTPPSDFAAITGRVLPPFASSSPSTPFCARLSSSSSSSSSSSYLGSFTPPPAHHTPSRPETRTDPELAPVSGSTSRVRRARVLASRPPAAAYPSTASFVLAARGPFKSRYSPELHTTLRMCYAVIKPPPGVPVQSRFSSSTTDSSRSSAAVSHAVLQSEGQQFDPRLCGSMWSLLFFGGVGVSPDVQGEP